MKRKRPSLRIAADRLLCRPGFGIPFFFAVLSAVFFLSFYGIGDTLSRFLEYVLLRWGKLAAEAFLRLGASAFAVRFLIGGVYGGLASAVAFLPQTLVFFLLVRALEACGYLARASYVTDHFFRRFGLSGKAVIPLLLGYGCAVSSVCACAEGSSGDDAVIRALPFVPCNARLPVLLFLADAFFPESKVLFAVSFFALSLALIFLSLLLSPSGSETPAREETLPPYRLPRGRELLREAADTSRGYLLRAGTAVGICCAVFSALAMLTPALTFTGDPSRSLLYRFAAWIAPIFRPLGFGCPEAAAALIFGFFAKENMIGIFQLAGDGLFSLFTPARAVSFTAFSMFYAPCASLLTAVARRSGITEAVKLFFRTLTIAYILSLILYTISHLLFLNC